MNLEEDSETSTVTSIDENTENLENPTRELLAEGFLQFFSPLVDQLENTVKQTQLSQLQVNSQLEILSTIIRDQIQKQNNYDSSALDSNVKTLNNIKNRVTVVTNILQSSQERLQSMHQKLALVESQQHPQTQ